MFTESRNVVHKDISRCNTRRLFILDQAYKLNLMNARTQRRSAVGVDTESEEESANIHTLWLWVSCR